MHKPHGHSHVGRISPRRLVLAIIISAGIMVAELIAGLIANSLALLSDAGHAFTDVLALSLSWYGIRQASRPADARMTYGYHRIGIMVALINAALIALIAIVILYEAYHRLRDPREVDSLIMFATASAGLLANMVVIFWLRAQARHSLNIRSAFFHAAGDALASVGVITGGLIIFFTDAFWLDPVISLIIVVIILAAAWHIAREAIDVMLEATPKHLDLDELVKTILNLSRAQNVHDLHVWSLTPQLHALSCHLLVDDALLSQHSQVLMDLQDNLMKRYNICHMTVQLECAGCEPHALYCELGYPPQPRKPSRKRRH